MRIQLELPPAKVQELKDVMEEAGIETYKELFNNALTLLDWAIREVKDGNVLASLDEKNDRHRVLVMPVLEKIGRQNQSKHSASV
jgi:hypothetical protein